ncbi:MAG: SDR family NAD(P)-dependent oxidoreductase, partial [Pseudomonadota bacterium]
MKQSILLVSIAANLKAAGEAMMGGRVEGKVAIVTGGASGLGAADARALAAEGATVVITDVDDAGEALAAGIADATGATVVFRHHDVTSEARWAEIVTDVESEFGGLDVLV